MTELRCNNCHKICLYLATGSRIAQGTVIYCHKCVKLPAVEVPGFLAGLMGMKK